MTVQGMNSNILVHRLNVKFSHDGTQHKLRNHLNNIIPFDVLEMAGFWIDSIVDAVALWQG